MTRRPGHSARLASILAVLVLAFAFAGANAADRKEIKLQVREHAIALPATDAGFLPAETDRLKFVQAGHAMRKSEGSRPAGLRWAFALEVRGDARPTQVRIEEIGKEADVVLVDDAAPVVTDGVWNGTPSAGCDIVRGTPCADWVFAKGPQTFIFRAVVRFDDGTEQVLYQGAAFDPGTMGPVWKYLGVKR